MRYKTPMAALLLAAASLSSLALPGAALAQQSHQHGASGTPPAGPPPGTTPPATASASTTEFKAAAMRMHQNMEIPYTGNADRDFAAGMIPHHQGAIEMARIELRHGKDPAMRAMAEAVIAAQEKEISELRAFLARPR